MGVGSRRVLVKTPIKTPLQCLYEPRQKSPRTVEYYHSARKLNISKNRNSSKYVQNYCICHTFYTHILKGIWTWLTILQMVKFVVRKFLYFVDVKQMSLKALFNNVFTKSEMHGPTCSVSLIRSKNEAMKKIALQKHFLRASKKWK